MLLGDYIQDKEALLGDYGGYEWAIVPLCILGSPRLKFTRTRNKCIICFSVAAGAILGFPSWSGGGGGCAAWLPGWSFV